MKGRREKERKKKAKRKKGKLALLWFYIARL